MNEWVVFPKALTKPVKVSFFRFRGNPPSVTGEQGTALRTPSRFPTESWYSHVGHARMMELHDQYTTTEMGGYGDLWTQEEIDQWIDTEFPINLPWSSSDGMWTHGVLLAVLPEVEIPSVFKHRNEVFSAISEWGELGFISPAWQKCWEKVEFDDDRTKEIKKLADRAGWEFIEWQEDTVRRDKREDDGKFDQITHAFYPGARRCGWCGSSDVSPSFLEPPTFITNNHPSTCLACGVGEESIDDRNRLNIEDME